MRGYIGLILGLTLAFGASESWGQPCGEGVWIMRIQTTQTAVEYPMAGTTWGISEYPAGMICIPAGNVRMGLSGNSTAPEQVGGPGGGLNRKIIHDLTTKTL